MGKQKSLNMLKRNKYVYQTGMLMTSTVLSMLFLIAINYFLTKLLTPVEYGNYSFIINIFVFSQTIFNFGFFYSICRLVSLSEDLSKVRRFYAAGILLWLFLSATMVVSLGVYSIFSDNLRENNLLGTFLLILPLGSVYLFTSFNELVLQGSNQISLLSISRLFPRILFLLILLFLFYSCMQVDILVILVSYFLSYTLVYVYIVYRLKPIARGYPTVMREIWTVNKDYGFPIYIGSVLSVGASNFVGVLLGMLSANNTSVGFYNIALQISMPLSMIPNIIATVLFKRFVSAEVIPKKILYLLLSLCLFIYICIIVFSKPFVAIVFGEDYVTSVTLLQYISLGFLLYGIADFFNKFLLSKGEGKELRDVSLWVGITILFISYPLIKLWGEMGASYVKLLSGIVYILFIVKLYSRSINHSYGN